ncbi:phosphoglycerate kinase [Patescibacteria group bacterium]|nr:phosphoglycerate kinase [Patescibacteria group bacterium]MBU0964153.1 phosphoglycerate kinase [Patescibacteria group bacterium]
MKLRSVKEAEVNNKRVFVRCGFDVPFDKAGHITDDKRVRECVMTLKYLLEQKAKLILCGHNGRPKGKVVPRLSMDNVDKCLASLLNRPVKKLNNCVGPEVEKAVNNMEPGDIVLLENLRFNPGEVENNPGFVGQLASLADIYVNEAFANSHRDHASMTGVPKLLPAFAGFRLALEVVTISNVMENPNRPLAAIIGGAKISDKLNVIKTFLNFADHVLIGGALANTILKAKGLSVGRSLVEDKMVEIAKGLALTDNRFHVPVDVVTADSMTEQAETRYKAVGKVSDDEYILDIGPDTIKLFGMIINNAKTIIWGGPMGYFELKSFSQGTISIARLVAQSNAKSIAGGGDTIEAINQSGYKHGISFLSTGGGAMLEFIEKKTLPAIEPLIKK